MKAGVNKVLIKIGKTVQDQIVTTNGVVLYKDFSFDENWHRTTFGEVIGVPAGANGLLTLGTYKHSDLDYDIRVGDIVHFNYIANNKDEKDNVFIIGDDFVYQLVIDQVFAVERNGEIIPQGNKVLVEKYYETVLESQFLIIPDGKKEIKSQGIVKYIGKNSIFNIGDRVVFEKPPMNIEIAGVLYLVIYEEDVICLL